MQAVAGLAGCLMPELPPGLVYVAPLRRGRAGERRTLYRDLLVHLCVLRGSGGGSVPGRPIGAPMARTTGDATVRELACGLSRGRAA